MCVSEPTLLFPGYFSLAFLWALPYLPRFLRYRNRENEISVSTLRVARASQRKRCPEQAGCAIPHERCCTPMIREMGFGRVIRVRWLCGEG